MVAHLLASSETAITSSKALLTRTAERNGIANAAIGARRISGTSGNGRRYRVPTITAVATATISITASICVTIGIKAFALRTNAMLEGGSRNK